MRVMGGLWVVAAVFACGEPEPVQIRGNAQKGPLLAGSALDAHALDEALAPAGFSYPTQVEDNLGAFELTANHGEPFLELVAVGYFHDELSGALSAGSLTLRAFASTTTSDVRVNLATTLARERIANLVDRGLGFDAAAAQAAVEVFGVFGLDATDFEDVNQLDLTGTAPGDVALVTLSAILLQYASDRSSTPAPELSLVVATLASDLAPDGIVAPGALLRDLAGAAHRLDAAAVRTNLEAIYAGQGVALTVPELTPYTSPLASRYPWRFAASIPVARTLPAGAAAGGKMFVLGGTDYAGYPEATGDTLELDPSTGAWSLRAPMPTGRYGHAVVELDGYLFAIGGRDQRDRYFTEVEMYDPISDVWWSRAPLPTPQYGACAVSTGGKLYVIGGTDLATGNNTDTLYELDPTANSWRALAPMPTPRMGAGCAVAAGRIYVVGGSDHARSDAVEEYDPTADSWVVKASLPTPLHGCSVASVGGLVYAIGGSDGSGVAVWNHVYDPASESWDTRTPPDFARTNAVAGVIDGEIFIVASSVNAATDTVEVYDPSKDD